MLFIEVCVINSSLRNNYQKQIKYGLLKEDLAQQHAIDDLSSLLIALESKVEHKHLSGIYLYGQVGRGKTMLMDLFYQSLPSKRKQRIHFHRFMQSVHQQLNQTSGIENPLKHIANHWAQDIDILCFDEFFVSDIADAILLSGLLHSFINNGVIIVATSNCHPQMLYKNGLQRERFIPAIDLIEARMKVVSVDGTVDHRVDNSSLLATLPFYLNLNWTKDNGKPSSVSETSLDGDKWLKSHYTRLVNEPPYPGQMVVNDRLIEYRGRKQGVIWFDFSSICDGPRSQLDYISLTNQFETVLVSNVPQFFGERLSNQVQGVEEGYQRSRTGLECMQTTDDIARRFIALVDEFYDRRVRLILTAHCQLSALYQGEQLDFEFKRCFSRLIEMQSF